MKVEFNKDRTFGVEFEVIGNYDAARYQVLQGIKKLYREGRITHDVEDIGCYEHTGSGNVKWVIKNDTSLHGHDRVGFEVVTPVLKGLEGLYELEQVAKVLNKHSHIEQCCGGHVHHGVSDLNKQAFKNLYGLMKKYERVVDYFVAPSRRRNQYCSHLPEADVFFRDTSAERLYHQYDAERFYRAVISRLGRRAVNFSSYAIRGTIEFRQHQGTVDFVKIKQWITLTQAFIETAKRRSSVQYQVRDALSIDNLFADLNWVKVSVTDEISEEIVQARTFLRERYRTFRQAGATEAVA